MSQQKTSKPRRNPMLRLALILLAGIVLVVVAAVLAYSAFQSSRNTPLAVAIYPGAEQVGTEAILAQGHGRLLYVSDSPAEEVGDFYVREMGEDCTVLTNSENAPDEPAVSYRCIADGSSFFVTQYTIVTVQPGTGEYAGRTLIDIEQVWGQ